jgi:hypothetical protein
MFQAQAILGSAGFYQIYAQYSGDSVNAASKSANANVVATGQGYVTVVGTNGPETHNTSIDVTIQ